MTNCGKHNALYDNDIQMKEASCPDCEKMPREKCDRCGRKSDKSLCDICISEAEFQVINHVEEKSLKYKFVLSIGIIALLVVYYVIAKGGCLW